MGSAIHTDCGIHGVLRNVWPGSLSKAWKTSLNCPHLPHLAQFSRSRKMIFWSPTKYLLSEWVKESVVSDSLQPHGLYSPWNSQGQNTGEGSLSLLQGIFPTQGSIPGLPHCRRILHQLSHKGSPSTYGASAKRTAVAIMWDGARHIET